MAHVYVGFHDQRNSSRVLKPPGGGTSNIFGTDAMPDVVPQSSPKREAKQSATIQQIIQTESVTKVTKSEHTSNVQNSSTTTHQNGNAITESMPVAVKETTSTPDITAVVTSKVEEMKIEERSSKSQVSETDSAGNTKIISSESNSEGSVQMNSSVNKGSSIGDILKQDEAAEEKKKIKSPGQRVPPGGYSSGLW